MCVRPQSIIRFEQLYLASSLLAVLGQILNLTGISGPSGARDLGLVFVLIIVAITYGMIFLFWYLIARRASNVAKWILVVMTAFGLLATVPMLITLAETDPLYAAISALVTVLQLAAMVFLFRRDAVEWLRSRGQVGVVDIATFN
jgi:hypothetical protein